jgi:hypothetical protein
MPRKAIKDDEGTKQERDDHQRKQASRNQHMLVPPQQHSHIIAVRGDRR